MTPDTTRQLGCFAMLFSCAIGMMGCSGSDTGGESEWLIPKARVVDGGPGKDGIPAIDNPQYVPVAESQIADEDRIIGIKVGGQARAIPLEIMDWHEVLNDQTDTTPLVLSYCPLTGSSLLWRGDALSNNPTYGVSGLLYNSNLILYDRETDSFWSQMRLQSVHGERIGELPDSLALVETRFATWRQMYPDTVVLSRVTGYTRNYDRYPYGSYRSDTRLLFGVKPRDRRLHEKTRVLGISIDEHHVAYQINNFAFDREVINTTIGGIPIVVVGSSGDDLGLAFGRTLADGTVLTLSTSTATLPALMTDHEGTHWDAFGVALNGPRQGQQLPLIRAHIAFWFAWAAFNPGSEISN